MCDHPTPLRKPLTTGVVQIVEVVSVAQENGVDSADVLDWDRRSQNLYQLVPRTLTLLRAFRVEARIGQETKRSDLDEVRGANQIRELCFGCRSDIYNSISNLQAHYHWYVTHCF